MTRHLAAIAAFTLVLLTSSAHAMTPTGQKISPADVSVRYGKPEAFKYLGTQTATQADRDAMQHAQFVFALELLYYAQQVPGCADEIKTAYTNLDTAIQRLAGADYEGKNCRTTPDGLYKVCDWDIGYMGRHYQFSAAAGLAIQACLTVNTKAAIACARYLPNDGILDFADVRKDGDHCVKGAAFKTPVREPYDQERAQQGALSTRTRLPDCTGHCAELAQATHHAHMQSTEQKCFGGPPPTLSPSDAHDAFEGDCGDDASCRHARQMKRFWGLIHPRWGLELGCTFAVMEDYFHGGNSGGRKQKTWLENQLKPEVATAPAYHRWIDTRLDGDNNHFLAHICANIGPRTPSCVDETSSAAGCFLVRPTCDTLINNCPRMSCEAWAVAFRKEHPELFTRPFVAPPPASM